MGDDSNNIRHLPIYPIAQLFHNNLFTNYCCLQSNAIPFVTLTKKASQQTRTFQRGRQIYLPGLSFAIHFQKGPPKLVLIQSASRRAVGQLHKRNQTGSRSFCARRDEVLKRTNLKLFPLLLFPRQSFPSLQVASCSSALVFREPPKKKLFPSYKTFSSPKCLNDIINAPSKGK